MKHAVFFMLLFTGTATFAQHQFPGPMHVLELADKLDLTPEQRVLTKALMDAHRAEALLSDEQVTRYVRLRGYEGGGGHRRQH